MRATVVLIVSLCGCNSLLGIDDMSAPGCEDSACEGSGSAGSAGSGSEAGHPACGTGSPCVTAYQVKGTDSQGLAIQSEPHYNHVLKYVKSGTLLGVVCQTVHGDQVDARLNDDGTPFTTWDQLDDGTWVYDWYMSTPHIVQGYSPGLAHCPGE